MPFFQHLPVEGVNRRIATSFGLAILLISVGFMLSLYSYSRSHQNNQRISYTFQVINSLEDVLSMAKDIETGTRGYLATNNSLFLEPRNEALQKLPLRFRQLRALLADNPEQLKEIDTLVAAVDAKIAISNRQVLLNSKSSDAIKKSYLLVGKAKMDDVRRQSAQMVQVEQAFMLERADAANQSFQNTLTIIFALSLITLAVLMIAYSMLTRELKRRTENEAQLRQYEAELKWKIQQLEVSNQELERFAFVASHDMQEPLRKIQTFGDLLNQQNPRIDGNGQLYLNKMLTSADRMSKLIRDLLSFSRLKNQPDAFQRTALNEVLDRVFVDLELLINTTRATITVGKLPAIDAVPSQIEQLFSNLISNALKYIKPGSSPQISITAEHIVGATYPGLLTNQPYYQFQITDNGIGFNEKYLDRIFDVFQRLHAQAVYEGTGIGLAICKRVVAYHNGYITARSQEGNGTTFIIVLPETQTAEFAQRGENRSEVTPY